MDIIDIGIKFTYVLLGVAAIAAIAMPLFQAIKDDPKSLIKSAIGLGGLVVIYLIGYAIAGDEVTPKYVEFNVDSSISKMVGGVLFSMYILMFTAVVGIIYSEVKNIIK